MSSTGSSPRIGRTYHESDSWFESRPRPKQASPDVIYLVLDDVGFGDLGCFGSELGDDREIVPPRSDVD